MLFAGKPWSGRKYSLDKMTLRELVWACVTYPAIQVYAALSALGIEPGRAVLRRARQQ